MTAEESIIVAELEKLGERVPESLMWQRLEAALQTDHDTVFSHVFSLRLRGVLQFDSGGWEDKDFIYRVKVSSTT